MYEMNSKWLILIIYILNIYKKAPLEVIEFKNYKISFLSNIGIITEFCIFKKKSNGRKKKT